ncbi:replication protein A 14 kDa subunit [Diaphorina citri]|uniref:Replication protein A 14 kDa subunit n=1 Tax=Diaphorina citri TaxID=121845 RepID=A0A1S3DAH9_DIACI|nr:replication protein A 14 kDa subunit-like [Diaphorina citri]XP_026683394.1 replication protein A 14 kDa subunit [Diaphorina citri]KAI5711097.1 hypothetical protein M8J75_014020 [Diaphorina citri]KAI5745943.1 hypothetical protein M8J76_015724 [Diaphorina citri]KAI5752931.1 hypothetical protein M8J77_021998 [Diaphorina citri]
MPAEIKEGISMRYSVNGSMLIKYMDQPITMIGMFIRASPDGRSFSIQAPDDQVVNCTLADVLTEPLSGYMMVVGKSRGKHGIECDDYIQLPSDKFDLGTYNQAVTIIDSIPNPWR